MSEDKKVVGHIGQGKTRLMRMIEGMSEEELKLVHEHYASLIKEKVKGPLVVFKSGGPYSLYCERCGCWVPNTANAEMRKEGIMAYNHHCENGVCDMKNGEKKA